MKPLNEPVMPCGTHGWPPCPPEPAVEVPLSSTGLYTHEQMLAHGLACQKHGYELHEAGHKLPQKDDL